MANNKWYAAHGYTPADDNCLQNVPNPGSYTDLSNDDVAFVYYSNKIYIHAYSTSSTAAESIPDVVIPDGNTSGSGRWLLKEIVVGEDVTQTLTSKTLTSPIINTIKTGATNTGMVLNDAGTCDLYYNNVKVLSTNSSAGITIFNSPDSAKFTVDVSACYVSCPSNNHYVRLTSYDSGGVSRYLFEGDPNGASSLYYNGTKEAETISGGLKATNSFTIAATTNVTGILDEDDMVSNSAVSLATQQSIKAYSDSATQTLTNKTLTSPVVNTIKTGATKTGAIFTDGGASELYYNNTKTFETVSGGVNVTGNLQIDSVQAFSKTNFGYGSTYTVILFGSDTAKPTFSFGYDPSGNTSSSFSGNGKEVLFRNVAYLLQPNAADTSFYKTITFNDGTVNLFYQGNSRVKTTVNGIGPTADNTFSCGDSSLRWTAVWAVNGTIQTSDKSAKEQIITSPLGLNFIKALKPVSYKWKDYDSIEEYEEGGEIKTRVIKHVFKRKHLGLVADDVKQILDTQQIDTNDFAGYINPAINDPNDTSPTGLRYSEFIAPMIKAIQEQQTLIETMQTALTQMQTEINNLKQQVANKPTTIN